MGLVGVDQSQSRTDVSFAYYHCPSWVCPPQNGEYSPRKLSNGSWWALLFCLFFMNQNWLWLVKVTAYRDRLSFLTSYKLKIRIILFAWIDMLIETVSYLKVGSGIARLNKKENYLGTCCRVINQCSSVASIIHMSKCLLLHPQPTLTGIRKRLYSPFPFIQKFGIFIT